MSSSPLSASQLDRIEDALEELELAGVPDALRGASDESSVEVTTHLDAYRQILVLSREAMPLVEAPAGVLSGVLAEARASAEAAPVAAAAPVEAAPGWWQRLRASVWVPALGFAGAAAMLLVMMRPASDDAAEATLARNEADAAPEAAAAKQKAVEPAEPQPSTVDGRLADAVHGRDEENLRGLGLSTEKATPQSPPAELGAALDQQIVEEIPEKEEEVVDADRTRGDRDDDDIDLKSGGLGGGKLPSTKSPKPARPGGARANSKQNQDKKDDKPTKKQGKKTGPSPLPEPPPPAKNARPKVQPSAPPKPAPTVDPEPDPDPGADAGGGAADKGERNDDLKLGKLVDRGEARRRAGNCGMARLDFNKAREAANANLRARAFAGLGLCELAAGNDAAAESLFSSARSADRSIGSFIDRERAKLSPPSKKKK